MSHPVWVRGLKHSRKSSSIQGRGVAPRVGAWIETVLLGQHEATEYVAPRVGAWIETADASHAAAGLSSHPVWVRGLKQYSTDFAEQPSFRRTPCGCVD